MVATLAAAEPGYLAPAVHSYGVVPVATSYANQHQVVRHGYGYGAYPAYHGSYGGSYGYVNRVAPYVSHVTPYVSRTYHGNQYGYGKQYGYGHRAYGYGASPYHY